MVDPYLESQYDLRSRHPDHGRMKGLWAQRSARARARSDCLLDLPCGSSRGATFDLFPPVPPARQPVPCLLFLHGGFWRSSDKSDCSFVSRAVNRHGIAAAVLNYTLAPALGLAEIVEEVRDSIAFIHASAHELGLDPRALFIGGHSAGAHLAAMAFATDWRARGLTTDPLRGGMGLSGIYDPTPLVETTHNRLLALDREAATSVSALNLPAGARRLGLIACGDRETHEFQQQSALYAAAAGPASRAIWLRGRNHYDVLLDFDDPESLLSEAVVSLIRNS